MCLRHQFASVVVTSTTTIAASTDSRPQILQQRGSLVAGVVDVPDYDQHCRLYQRVPTVASVKLLAFTRYRYPDCFGGGWWAMPGEQLSKTAVDTVDGGLNVGCEFGGCHGDDRR